MCVSYFVRYSVHSVEAVAAHGGRKSGAVQEEGAKAAGKGAAGSALASSQAAAGGQSASAGQSTNKDSKKKGLPKWFKGFGGK